MKAAALCARLCRLDELYSFSRQRTLQMNLKPGATFEGPSKTLTDAHFLLFSGITGDVHPIHYDVEYAKQTRFGKPLAHGLLLASMTALGASTARDNIEGLVFVEQGCRYLKPAVVGDTIRPRFVLEKAWHEGHREFCRFRTMLLNQRGETLLEGYHVYQSIAGHGKGESRESGDV
jgi:3-hydroxybutyryl-CoA dehydratase